MMKREKLFGFGRTVPMDRNAKARVMVLARALTRRTEAGRHYGPITAKALAVLEALLWRFHNAASGKCFPSYEAIAEAAGCARSTVYEAILALERVGLITWSNRLIRVRERCRDLFGLEGNRVRVHRTSNAYVVNDPGAVRTPISPKSDRPTRTGIPKQTSSRIRLPGKEGAGQAPRSTPAETAGEAIGGLLAGLALVPMPKLSEGALRAAMRRC